MTRWRRKLSELTSEARLRRIALVLSIIGTLVGIVIGVRALTGGDSAPGAAVEPTLRPSDLKVVDLLVGEDFGKDPYYGRLEVTLQNTGGQRVVIDRARIEIRHVYHLPLCYTQGSLPLSSTYGTLLPADAKPGDLVEVPLHQQIGADEADRFAISLGVGGEELDGVYLFELDVSLLNSGPQNTLPLGRVLISLPESPSEPHYYWGDETAEGLEVFNQKGTPAREMWGGQMPCWQANFAILSRELQEPGARSAQMKAIAEALVEPTYDALEPSAD